MWRRPPNASQGRPPRVSPPHNNQMLSSSCWTASFDQPDEDRPWFMMGETAFAQYVRQRSHQILRNGNDAVAASLAVKHHLRAPSLQLKVLRVDAGSLQTRGRRSSPTRVERARSRRPQGVV